MTMPMLSFIIPAFNEERSLPGTLCSIERYVPETFSYQVVVADNGSTDDTVAIARKMGASVVCDPSATVAGLRNLAVAQAQGQVYVFIDADVELTEQWAQRIPDVYRRLIENPGQLTGSRCGVGRDAGWIETCWFKPLIGKPANYINSGHLIVNRALFERIGGFDPGLQTGEDYRFSMTAKALDADICPDPLLEVVHTGYPKTVTQFMRREIWHGKGDCVPFSAMLKSRVALTGVLVGGGTLASAGALFSSLPQFGMAGFSMLLAFCTALAAFKHKSRGIGCLLAVSALYYVYFTARFLSCVVALLPSAETRRHR